MRVLVTSGSRAVLPDPVYPLGAAIIATVCRRAGHEVTWFDALRHRRPLPALAEQIASSRPEAILLSIRNIDSGAFPSPECFFEDHHAIVTQCRAVSRAPILVGGSGFSLMPEAFMRALEPNCGVVGDGALEVVSLLSSIARGRQPKGVFEGVLGAGRFHRCDRDLFDASWYYEKGGVANIQSKLGCARKCIYCTYPLLEGRGTSVASPDAVVDEMASLAKAGIRHFFFVDSVFNSPESHAAAICEAILKRDLHVSFTGYFVPRTELPEFPELLRRAGCTAVEFGTDALSDPMLWAYRKGFTVDDAVRCTERFVRAGIDHCHNLIFGGPGETEATMEESVRTMDRLNPTAVIATIGLRVYPKTQLALIASDRDNTEALSEERLDPIFFVEEAVAGRVVELVGRWVDDRERWVCPGLSKRYNARYLARRRMHLGHKGVLWPLL